mmetsp:Transcript_14505/g.32278  ORF Transcript_14505/g.32278 Transcript_14505/m.32278 type:complete len:214 (-) Transcript_14505:160-801(-)
MVDKPRPHFASSWSETSPNRRSVSWGWHADDRFIDCRPFCLPCFMERRPFSLATFSSALDTNIFVQPPPLLPERRALWIISRIISSPCLPPQTSGHSRVPFTSPSGCAFGKHVGRVGGHLKKWLTWLVPMTLWASLADCQSAYSCFQVRTSASQSAIFGKWLYRLARKSFSMNRMRTASSTFSSWSFSSKERVVLPRRLSVAGVPLLSFRNNS